MSLIISGPMRIANWDKCHRGNDDCPEIPSSCGQHDVRTVTAEEHTLNTGTEEIIQRKGKLHWLKRENWEKGEKKNRGGMKKRKH